MDPVRDAVETELHFKLITPPQVFENVWKCKVSTKLFTVERYIKELHGGSVRNIRMVSGLAWQPYLIIKDTNKTLKDIGIVSGSAHTILYDFDPVIDPLFKASIASK